MTQEDKELLLKDLCSRLPYQPKLQIYYEEMSGSGVFDEELWEIDIDGQYCNGGRRLEDIKPYLRSMLSMTDEEINEFTSIHENVLVAGKNIYTALLSIDSTNWLLEHHFDFMGLISKGLAIEVTKENNHY